MECLVIGCGPAGENAALAAAERGKRVLVVDDRFAEGGVCVHTGTIPSKSMREVALAYLQRGSTDPISMNEVREKVRSVIQDKVDLIRQRLTSRGIEFIGGHASFGPDQQCYVTTPNGLIQVDAERYILGVGTEPRRPPFAEFDGNHRIITSDEVMNLPTLPASLVVVGGGVIGCEYASIFSALGVQVTIVESRPALLSDVDTSIAEAFRDYLESQGVQVHLNASVKRCFVDPDGSSCTQFADGSRIRSECILVSAGRQRITEHLGLNHMGITPDERGKISTQVGQRTAHPKVFAAGDVSSVMALASTAARDGRLAGEGACGNVRSTTGTPLPVGIYTIPEISFVGRSEQQLKQEGVPYESGFASYREAARGVITAVGTGCRAGQRDGLLKILCDRESREILGVHIMGYGATELVHIAQAHMLHRGSLDDLLQTTFNYPTYAELYRFAALDLEQRLRMRGGAAATPTVAATV